MYKQNATSNDGAVNTTRIINKYGNIGTYAAKLYRDYTGGVFTDWYLPSGDEMHILNLKQQVVGGFPNPELFTSFFIGAHPNIITSGHGYMMISI